MNVDKHISLAVIFIAMIVFVIYIITGHIPGFSAISLVVFVIIITGMLIEKIIKLWKK